VRREEEEEVAGQAGEIFFEPAAFGDIYGLK
jgi:hypothetical protein